MTDQKVDSRSFVFGPNTKLKVNGKAIEYQHSDEISVGLQIGTILTAGRKKFAVKWKKQTTQTTGKTVSK